MNAADFFALYLCTSGLNLPRSDTRILLQIFPCSNMYFYQQSTHGFTPRTLTLAVTGRVEGVRGAMAALRLIFDELSRTHQDVEVRESLIVLCQERGIRSS